jgi:enoyl-CoA hydratase/carnithine racemase
MSAGADILQFGTGEEPVLLVHREPPVLRLTLNRPKQRNALSHGLLRASLEALDAASSDPDVRVVVLAGSGSAFSAGHDLREVQSSSAAELEELFALCSRLMLRLQEIPQPVIARVHGIATAAGCQLVSACDLAVAADVATFATPGVNIGLFCSTPAVPVVRSVGRKRALEMLLTGEPIDARTALEWGLVNRVVALADVDAEIARLVSKIADTSAPTIALGKRAFYQQIGLLDRDAYELASAAMCANAASDDAREGIDAFINKRRATWRQR